VCGIGIGIGVEPLHCANGSIGYTQSLMFFLQLRIVRLETFTKRPGQSLWTYLFQSEVRIFGLSKESGLSTQIEANIS
jgi:hypothetical protein